MQSTKRPMSSVTDAAPLLAGFDTITYSSRARISQEVRSQLTKEKEAAQVAAKVGAVHCPEWLEARVLPNGGRGASFLLETGDFTVKIMGEHMTTWPGLCVELRSFFLHTHEEGAQGAVEASLAWIRQHLLADQDAKLVHALCRFETVTPSRFDLHIDWQGGFAPTMILTVKSTGMRQGELLGLRWRDVDLDGGVLSVRQALTFDRIMHQHRFKEPKNKRSRRQIKLPPPTIQALRHHYGRQQERRLEVGIAWIDNDLVFPNPIGGPSAASTSHHALRKLLVRANLPRIRFHDLRHTCATLLLRAKVNPKVVSELLGHSSVAITLDIYSHVLPDMQDDATAAMSAILGDEES